MPVVTTLGFRGRTEEALEFYAHALDAETLFMMRFRDSPDSSHTKPGMEDMIFHATFMIEGTVFMASDVGYSENQDPQTFRGFSLALQLRSVARAWRVFATLSDGGKTVVPLEKSPFTAWYGIVEDRFGLSWKITVDEDDA